MKKLILTILFLGAGLHLWSANAADTLNIQRKQSTWQMALPGGGRMECNLQAEWPETQDNAINTAFGTWLSESLKPMLELEEGTGHALANRLEQCFLEEGKKARQQAVEQAVRGQVKPFNLALDVDIRCVWNKTNLVTFRLHAIHYNATGERSEIVKEKTWHMPSGSDVTWDELVNPKRRQRFNSVMVEALQSYFGVNDWENLKLKLAQGGQLTLLGFPLPKGGPALEKAGIRLCYDAGEIAPTGAGRPTAFVPYSSIASHLTANGKKLIK